MTRAASQTALVNRVLLGALLAVWLPSMAQAVPSLDDLLSSGGTEESSSVEPEADSGSGEAAATDSAEAASTDAKDEASFDVRAEEGPTTGCGGTGCHGAYREKSFVHKPVFEGKCDLCHVAPLKDKDAENPHGQSSAGLLSGLLPKNNYGTYSQAAFSACFSTCHSPSAIEEPKTEDATRFRNGDDNLHFRHVARYPRGRSCILCHEPHQAENFALIDDHMDYGNEKLTLEFSITKHGGRCETSCHIPVEYDRDERVPSKMRLVEYR